MTNEKRKLIADAWCEVQAVSPTIVPKNPTFQNLLDGLVSMLCKRADVWVKHGLLGDPDLDEWLNEIHEYDWIDKPL